MKRNSKLYPATLAPFMLSKLKNGKGNEFCSIWSDLSKTDHYTLSSDGVSDYEVTRDAIQKATDEKKAIKVNYIKRGGKRFINALA